MEQLNFSHRRKLNALQFVDYIVCVDNMPQLILITNFNRVSCRSQHMFALSWKRDVLFRTFCADASTEINVTAV